MLWPFLIEMKHRPRILYVSSHWPHKETCASEKRSVNVARALGEIGSVDFLIVDTEGGAAEWHILSEREFAVVGHVDVAAYCNQTIIDKLKWAILPSVKYPHGCGVDQESLEITKRFAQHYDLIWFSKLRTANMFPQWTWKRSVLDIDDIPSTFERSRLSNKRDIASLPITLLRYLSWRRRDCLLGSRFDVLGVCSEGDKKYLRALGVTSPVYVIPNGFEEPDGVPKRQPASPPLLGFIGIFDYAPNTEGIRWFAEKCWPLVKRVIPDARLRLVGRHSDREVGPIGRDVDCLGWIERPAGEIATWAGMIVPIRTGAGTRGKIAQSFSLKCPIVSTSIGAYGYAATDGNEMRLADTADDFAKACIDVIQNPASAEKMAERAWKRYLENWTWTAIRPRIVDAAKDCLRRTRAARQTDDDLSGWQI